MVTATLTAGLSLPISFGLLYHANGAPVCLLTLTHILANLTSNYSYTNYSYKLQLHVVRAGKLMLMCFLPISFFPIRSLAYRGQQCHQQTPSLQCHQQAPGLQCHQQAPGLQRKKQCYMYCTAFTANQKHSNMYSVQIHYSSYTLALFI